MERPKTSIPEDPTLFEITDYNPSVTKFSFNYGWGANVLIIESEPGLLLIDSGYRDMIKPFAKRIQKKYSKPILKIINTHFHGDHVGCNGLISEDGEILVHKNVEKRKYYIDAYNLIDSKTNIAFGSERILIIPLPHGHSATDMIIFLEKSNIIHTGDLYLSDSFPLISSTGGNTVYKTLENLQIIRQHINKQTIIVSGHGSDSSIKDLENYIDMVKSTIIFTENLISKGILKSQIKKSNFWKKYENYNGTINFITKNSWVDNIWRSYHEKNRTDSTKNEEQKR